jgi:hypothetical protein
MELFSSDLQYAMTKIGFSAESLGGSVWVFKPILVQDIDQLFPVHGTHPGNEYAYHMARNMSNRPTATHGSTAKDLGEAERVSEQSEID